MPFDYRAGEIYEGTEPYLFISYSHRDEKEMEKVKAFLTAHRIRFWFDNGLHSGDDWNLVIAKHLQNASVCLLLLSPSSAESEYVKNELNFAMNHRIPIHTLLLKQFDLPPDIEMMTGRIQMIALNSGYEERLLKALPAELFEKKAEEAPEPMPDEPNEVQKPSKARAEKAGADKRKVSPALWIGVGGALVVLIAAIVLIAALGGGKGAGQSPDKSDSPKEQTSAKDGQDDPEPKPNKMYSYSLAEVGTIDDPKEELKIQYDTLFLYKDGQMTLLTALGEAKFDRSFSEVTYLGRGVYAVTGEDDLVGLVSNTGEVLIDCEATKISLPIKADPKTNRYLLVTYAGGQNGAYSLVYDLDKQSFVQKDILRLTGGEVSLTACGDSFFVTEEGSATVLFDADGQALFESEYAVDVGKDIFIASNNGTYRVYDDKAEQLYASNRYIRVIEGNSGYITRTAVEKQVVMDRFGNQVTELDADTIYSESGGVYLIDRSGYSSLVKEDGTMITDALTYDFISEIGYGYYYAYTISNGEYLESIIGEEGVVAEGASTEESALVFVKGKSAYVLNQRAFRLTLEDAFPTALGTALISAQSESSGMYGVFDLFNGNQLLNYRYEKIRVAAGYLYAYENGAWTVFEIGEPTP